MQKMKMLRLLILAIVASACIGLVSTPSQAYAATCADPSSTEASDDGVERVQRDSCDPALGGGDCANVSDCGLIKTYLNPAIRFIAAFFGVAVVIAIIYGGIQYGSSGGDPQKVASGKKWIINAIVALVAFFFLYALLNFLIPGGII